MKPLELKARLLCEGANPEGEETLQALDKQNPQKILRGGLSAGLKAKISVMDPMQRLPVAKEFTVNFPLYGKRKVPLKIRTSEEGFEIIENGQTIGKAEILKPPEWYNETVEGYPITSIFTQHGNQLAGAVWEWCALFNTGTQCRFCVMDKSQQNPNLRDIYRKIELMLLALDKIPKEAYSGIILNGGMDYSSGRGLNKILPAVNQIRQKLRGIPIAVEITPPEDQAFIRDFADAGGSSLMMNLEMWDIAARQKLIPGKNALCPRNAYLKAFKKAVEVLGKGKVSTCFVVGTESKESLKQGIKTVIDYDVVPSPLAGRYFEQFDDYPFAPNVDFRELIEIFKFTRGQMAARGLASTDKAGCVSCGMCDIIGDNDM